MLWWSSRKKVREAGCKKTRGNVGLIIRGHHSTEGYNGELQDKVFEECVGVYSQISAKIRTGHRVSSDSLTNTNVKLLENLREMIEFFYPLIGLIYGSIRTMLFISVTVAATQKKVLWMPLYFNGSAPTNTYVLTIMSFRHIGSEDPIVQDMLCFLSTATYGGQSW